MSHGDALIKKEQATSGGEDAFRRLRLPNPSGPAEAGMTLSGMAYTHSLMAAQDLSAVPHTPHHAHCGRLSCRVCAVTHLPSGRGS